VVVLKERLNPAQWIAVLTAAGGVAYLTVQMNAPPWIALGLAVSFGLYGLLRKVAHVGSISALAFESGVLVVPVALYIAWIQANGTGAFGRHALLTDVLLVSSGFVTAVPLVLFAYGARRIPYTTVGILQYISPTLQLGCGVFLFGEPFTRVQAVGFGFIWLALLVYAADGLLRRRLVDSSDF
jgi:chloramphenicol-sensitive protein RarD